MQVIPIRQVPIRECLDDAVESLHPRKGKDLVPKAVTCVLDTNQTRIARNVDDFPPGGF